MSQVLGAFGLLDPPISSCNGPFSLGGSFEIYEPFISLIFQFISGRGEPRVTETANTKSVNTGARLYSVE
jgi:hypothetical protein